MFERQELELEMSHANSNSSSSKGGGGGGGVPTQSPSGNAGFGAQTTQLKPQAHFVGSSQHQTQSGSHFQGHFQLADPQLQPQSQVHHAHSQAQVLPRAHYPPQPQPPGLSPLHSTATGSVTAGVSSPPVSVSAKKAQQRPPYRPPGSSATSSTSMLKTMELAPAPAARRKKRGLADQKIPDRVVDLVPESRLYARLLELEGRVDVALSRTKTGIQESLRNPPTVQKTLRIYVFNTYSNQAQQTDSEEKNSEPPCWTLKIVGRILDNEADPEAAGMISRKNSWYPEFSYFFKRITVSLDQGLYPNNHVILWENSRSPALHEGFEVKRNGDKEFTVMVRLDMNYMLEKFKLSPSLMEVLGIEVDTRPRIIAALWHYVKVKKLQHQNDPSVFTCDPPLRKVFGEEKVKFTMVPQKLSQHLSAPQPVLLSHKIKLSGNCPAGTTCYDILTDVPFQSEKEMTAFLGNIENEKEINVYNETISATISKIHGHFRRWSFFLGFSQSPAEFINILIASQSRDLKLSAGHPSHNTEKESGSDLYNQTWAEDAVVHYLNRKSFADAPGST